MPFLDALAYEIGWTILHVVTWIAVYLAIVAVGKVRERFPRYTSNLLMYIRVVVLALWGVFAAGMFTTSIVI